MTSLKTGKQASLKHVSILLCLSAALIMAMGWGVRGAYGHSTGAAMPGALVSLVICLCAHRHNRGIHQWDLFSKCLLWLCLPVYCGWNLGKDWRRASQFWCYQTEILPQYVHWTTNGYLCYLVLSGQGGIARLVATEMEYLRHLLG